MKFTKAEKVWLIVVVLFYVLYNLPMVPSYDSPAGTLVHALLTLVPLWVSVYIGLFKVARTYDTCNSKEKGGEEKEC